MCIFIPIQVCSAMAVRLTQAPSICTPANCVWDMFALAHTHIHTILNT